MITLVQPPVAGFTTLPVLTLALRTPPRPGSLVVVATNALIGVSVANTVVDGQGNVYKQVPAVSGASTLLYLTPAPPNASATLMCSVPGGTYITAFAAEFNDADSPLALVGVAPPAAGLGPAINQPTYVSPTTQEQLLVAGCQFASNLLGLGAPWSALAKPQGSGNAIGDWAEYQIINSAGSFPVHFTGDSAASFHTVLAAFAVPPPATGSGTPPGAAGKVNKSVQFASDTVPYIGGVLETTRRNPS